MMRTVRIHVTNDDIFVGIRGSAYNCPVYHAVRRKGLNVTCVTTAGVKLFQRVDYIEIPPRVREFMRLFDRWGCSQVVPFEFDLEVPDDVEIKV